VGSLRKRLEAVALLVKTPVEELDDVEAQAVNDTAHDPHGKVYGVPDQNDKQSNKHPNAFGCEGAGGEAIAMAESVTTLRHLIDTLGPAQSGKFFNYDGREYPW